MKELQTEWPNEPADRQLAELREDLLFALEHVPGDVVNGPDRDAWQGTSEYKDVEIHLGRLRQADGD